MRLLQILLVVVGAVLLYLGGREGILAHEASAEPQEITCKQLGMRGPGDNAHVRLQEFVFAKDTYVFEEKQGGGGWSRVWIPTLPLESADAPPPTGPVAFRVIVRSDRIRDEGDLQRVGKQDTLDGLVVNDIDSLGDKEKKLLRAHYPDMDFKRCWIVDHGREPKSMLYVAAILVAGLVLLGSGIRLYTRHRSRPVVRPKAPYPHHTA